MRATWDLSLPWLDISVQTPFWSKMGEKGKKTTANFLFQLFEKKFPFFSEKASIYECRSIIIWRRNWSLSTKWLKRNQVLCSLFYYPHPLSFYPHFLQFKSSRPSIVRHLKIIFWQLELIKGMMIAFLQSKLLHNCTIWYKNRTKIDCWLKCVNYCTEKCLFSGCLCQFPFHWIIRFLFEETQEESKSSPPRDARWRHNLSSIQLRGQYFITRILAHYQFSTQSGRWL